MIFKNLLLIFRHYLNVLTLTALLIFLIYVKINYESTTTTNNSIKFCLSETGQCKSAATMYDILYVKNTGIPSCALKDSPSSSTCYPDAVYQTCIYGLTLTEATLKTWYPNLSHNYVPLFWPILILSFLSIVVYLIFDKEIFDITYITNSRSLLQKKYFIAFFKVNSIVVAALLVVSAKLFTVVFTEDCTPSSSDYCTQISVCQSEIRSVLVTDDLAITKYNVILVSFIGFIIIGIMISSWESILQALVFDDVVDVHNDDGNLTSLLIRANTSAARDIMTRNWNLEVKMNDDNLECPICLGIMKLSKISRKKISQSESMFPNYNNQLSIKSSVSSKSPRFPLSHGDIVPVIYRSSTSDSAAQVAPMTLFQKPVGFIGRIIEVEEKSTDLPLEKEEEEEEEEDIEKNLNNNFMVDCRQATNSSSFSGPPTTSSLSNDHERQDVIRRGSHPYNSRSYSNNNNNARRYSNTYNSNNRKKPLLENEMSMESFYWSPNSSRSIVDRDGDVSLGNDNDGDDDDDDEIGVGCTYYYEFIDTCKVMVKKEYRNKISSLLPTYTKGDRENFHSRTIQLKDPQNLATTSLTTSSALEGQQQQHQQLLSSSVCIHGNDIETETDNNNKEILRNTSPIPYTSSTSIDINDNYHSSLLPTSSTRIKSQVRSDQYHLDNTFESLQSFESTSQASHQLRQHPMSTTTTTTMAMTKNKALSRLVVESKESAISSTSSYSSMNSLPIVVVTRRFHSMRPTGFALSSNKFKSPKHNLKPLVGDTGVKELENGSNYATEDAVVGNSITSSKRKSAIKQSKTTLIDIYDGQEEAEFEIRRPYFDLSRSNTEEVREGDQRFTIPATVPEFVALPVMNEDECKVNEIVKGRRVSFQNITHPPYSEKISPLTSSSSGSTDYKQGQDILLSQGSLPMSLLPLPQSALITSALTPTKHPGDRGPQRMPYRSHYHMNDSEMKGRGSVSQRILAGSRRDNYSIASPLIIYESKLSSDTLISYEQQEQQEHQQQLHQDSLERKEEKGYEIDEVKADVPVGQTRANYLLSVDMNNNSNSNSNSSYQQAPIISSDTLNSILSASRAFPALDSSISSSILSSKASIITIAADELLAQVPCGHIFHKECILEWANHHTTCPVCRKDLTSGLV